MARTNFVLGAAQAAALGKWAWTGPDPAVLNVEPQNDGSIYVVQGDESACIDRGGSIIEMTPHEHARRPRP